MHSRQTHFTPPDSNLNLCLACLIPSSPSFCLIFFPPRDMIYLCQRQGHPPVRKCHWRRHHRPLLLIIPLPHRPPSPAPPTHALLKLGSPTSIMQAGESSVGLAPHQGEGCCLPGMLPSSFHITRVTRHCLLSIVTSLFHTKRGIKK